MTYSVAERTARIITKAFVVFVCASVLWGFYLQNFDAAKMYALNMGLYRLLGIGIGIFSIFFWVKVGVDYEFLPPKCREIYARIFYREDSQ